MLHLFGSARPFLREAAGLSLAGAMAQLLALMFSPLVLRRYAVEAFGVASLLILVAGSLGQLSCMKYDLALLALKKEGEERPLVLAAAAPVGLAAALLLVGAPVFGVAGRHACWMALILAAVGFYTLGSALCLRSVGPVPLGRAVLLRAVLQVAAQLALCGWRDQVAAMLAAYLISYLGGVAALLPGFLSVRRGRWGDAAAAARRHREYPLLLLPGALAFSLAAWMHGAMVLRFDPVSLGCYAVVERLLAAPMTVISSVVGQLFLRWIFQVDRRQRDVLYERVSLTMLALSSTVCLLLYPAAPLIPRFFGEEWRGAVGILRALLPLFAVRFAVAPVASGLIAADRRQTLALWQLGLLLLTIGAQALSLWRGFSLLGYLALYSFLMSAGYLALWHWGRAAVREKGGDVD